MSPSRGIEILEVSSGSPALRAGIQPGETLLSINGSPVHDELDLMFLQSDDRLEIEVLDREHARRTVRIRKRFERDLGIRIREMRIRRCKSKCIFCFVDQNPPGLRQSLYFKDGDFRMSFLHGNYITANELADDDLRRILEERLSPLYISVHTTNPELRLQMLGVKKGPPILERLKFLTENRIQIHAQIVLCPGWNDGAELERTVKDLLSLGESLLTIAVVPVGLTDYRENLAELTPVTPATAQEVLKQAKQLQRLARRKRGEQILFFADEFYILSDEPWPNYRDVEILHQLENGVGMLYSFYEDFRDCKLPRSVSQSIKVAALTGLLGARALEPVAQRLGKIKNIQFDVLPIENTMFGRGVTVSGLLPGRDFFRAIELNPGYDAYFIPRNALRHEGDLFLDDMTLEELITLSEDKAKVIDGNACDLAEAIVFG